MTACGEYATTCPHAGCADEIARLTRERDEALAWLARFEAVMRPHGRVVLVVDDPRRSANQSPNAAAVIADLLAATEIPLVAPPLPPPPTFTLDEGRPSGKRGQRRAHGTEGWRNGNGKGRRP